MAYGVHPTRYGKLSDMQLYSLYRESSYSKLSEDEKLDLLQETANRDALERGEIGAPKVQFVNLRVNEIGNAGDGVIKIDRDLAIHGIRNTEYKGRIVRYSVSDYNIQSLNTVLHENIHCFQDQIVDGTIKIDNAQLTQEYQANTFVYTPVLRNGRYQLGSHYLEGETANGYYLYYFQATERDAYLTAEKKTESILNELVQKYGTEASFEAYARYVEREGYAVIEQEAMKEFQNPNFIKELNQTLKNQYFGTDVPVDANMEAAVKAEMVATYYKELQQNMSINKEETKMSFDPKPVSLEEYNQSLRDAVNAYYVHAMNNPSMSKEEAISSTAQMSEQYLSAVEDFQAAQAGDLQSSASINIGTNTGAGEETGGIAEDSSGGVDNGGMDDTGGIDDDGMDI